MPVGSSAYGCRENSEAVGELVDARVRVVAALARAGEQLVAHELDLARRRASGAIRRSARIAHVESKVAADRAQPDRAPVVVRLDDDRAAERAVRCRTVAPGNRRVPRSLAASSSASMPAFAGVICRAPPSR